MENKFDTSEKATYIFERQYYEMLLEAYKWDGETQRGCSPCSCNVLIDGKGWSRICLYSDCTQCFCSDRKLFKAWIDKYRVELAKVMLSKRDEAIKEKYKNMELKT